MFQSLSSQYSFGKVQVLCLVFLGFQLFRKRILHVVESVSSRKCSKKPSLMPENSQIAKQTSLTALKCAVHAKPQNSSVSFHPKPRIVLVPQRLLLVQPGRFYK
jgi:hypothetical protein